MSDSMRPHRRQRTRLPCPWDSPGKNTGVGCHFLLQCMKVKSEREVTQSSPTLSDPMDCSLPGSSTHEIFQVRVLVHRVNNLFLGSAGVPMLVSQLQRVLVDVPLGSRCELCESWALVTQERCRLQSSISDVNFSAC